MNNRFSRRFLNRSIDAIGNVRRFNLGKPMTTKQARKVNKKALKDKPIVCIKCQLPHSKNMITFNDKDEPLCPTCEEL